MVEVLAALGNFFSSIALAMMGEIGITGLSNSQSCFNGDFIY
ncbi:hypothetical protein [Neobacillus sp. PS2-9]|nr:hypothetical protein [Neobacillus sp. PS2-9]WML58781.1 hypothetical protein RCG25_03010 [Neobacillus sp. PS2-9]